MCQFAAYQPENVPLSRRTVDCRVIFIFCANAFGCVEHAQKRPAPKAHRFERYR